MGMRKTDKAGKRTDLISPRRKGGLAMNFAGLAAAFGIGFGGLFVVQYRLEQEEEKVKFLENYKSSYGRFSFLAH